MGRSPYIKAKPEIERILLGVQELGDALGISARKVRMMVDAGQLPPPIKLRGSSKWSRRVIDEWIEGGCPSVDCDDIGT